MSKSNELRDLETHFSFGENWAAYSDLIDQEKIKSAEAGLLRLVSRDDLAGASFLDIGCGSGIHSLAALSLGARTVTACDLDPNSVKTTHKTLSTRAPKQSWATHATSVFDISGLKLGRFDIVYSWGVLHHTGDMVAALQAAANCVAPGGLFVFALYRRTWLDWFWRVEKRWYTNASERSQKRAQAVFDSCYRLARALTGRKPDSDRGMDYWHDIHDWLGGYPYESVLAPEVDRLMASSGFEKVRVLARGRSIGLFGSGCDEYVYRSHA